MWSDPEDIEDWAINARGAGWVFGSKVTNDFCHINGLELIARAHQLVQEGYIHWFKVRKKIHRIKTWWQSGVLRTIVTGAITWQRSWRWRRTVKKSLRSSRRFLSQWRALTSKMFYPTSYDRMYSIFSIFLSPPSSLPSKQFLQHLFAEATLLRNLSFFFLSTFRLSLLLLLLAKLLTGSAWDFLPNFVNFDQTPIQDMRIDFRVFLFEVE